MAKSPRDVMIALSRMAVLAVLLAFGAALMPAHAQVRESGTNPTAAASHEQQLLQELNKLRGRVTVPDQQAGMLEQPQGRHYQTFHERLLP